MSRISFDRVSNLYDVTRAMPPDMEKAVMKALIECSGVEHFNRVLELGVGTGRIAGPISEMVPTLYFGIDVSLKMMEKISEKQHDRVILACGDVCELPFKPHSFDVVLAVHVFHLVREWRQALREAIRVLAPGGVIIIAGEGGMRPGTLNTFTSHMKPEAREELFAISQKFNFNHNFVGMTDINDAALLLKKLGASVTLPPEIEHVMELPVSVLPGLLQARAFQFLWEIPDDILTTAVSEVRRALEKHYGDLNTKSPITRRFQFVRAAF